MPLPSTTARRSPGRSTLTWRDFDDLLYLWRVATGEAPRSVLARIGAPPHHAHPYVPEWIVKRAAEHMKLTVPDLEHPRARMICVNRWREQGLIDAAGVRARMPRT